MLRQLGTQRTTRKTSAYTYVDGQVAVQALISHRKTSKNFIRSSEPEIDKMPVEKQLQTYLMDSGTKGIL